MHIQIHTEADEPPRGYVVVGSATIRFSGWLDLLGVLSELLRADELATD